WTSGGAGKSGNTCHRFTPPCKSLSRVISRITDSVNWVAFVDPASLDMMKAFYAVRRVFFFLAGAEALFVFGEPAVFVGRDEAAGVTGGGDVRSAAGRGELGPYRRR